MSGLDPHMINKLKDEIKSWLELKDEIKSWFDEF
jgi:hypothetical protein